MSNVLPFRHRTTASHRGRPEPPAVNSEPGEQVAPVVELAAVTPAVYTVAEVAQLLGLSAGTTYAMVRAGQIPARKFGGQWKIPKRRFHAWLDDLPEATTEEVGRALGLLP